MSEGQGSVSYSRPPGGGSGGGGTVTGANNGASLNGTNVVLGNDLGDLAQPAILLNDRAIPMGGRKINLLEPGAQTGFISIDSGAAAMYNFFKGTDGQEPASLITIQGATGEFGNYFLTLDESFTNPDGQIDAVAQWGYNQDGVGANATGPMRLAGGQWKVIFRQVAGLNLKWSLHRSPSTEMPIGICRQI